MPRQRQNPTTAYDFGYASGYNDRHSMSGRSGEEEACAEESNGYLRWLAGWRAGQAARRAEKPPQPMLYEPLYPQKRPAGQAKVDKCSKPNMRKKRAARASN